MKILLIIIFTGLLVTGQGQSCSRGLMYVPNLYYSNNPLRDSNFVICIKGDSLAVIKNLLMYCLQEKNLANRADDLLDFINLDFVSKSFESKIFDRALGNYRKALRDIKVKRDRSFPQYIR